MDKLKGAGIGAGIKVKDTLVDGGRFFTGNNYMKRRSGTDIGAAPSGIPSLLRRSSKVPSRIDRVALFEQKIGALATLEALTVLAISALLVFSIGFRFLKFVALSILKKYAPGVAISLQRFFTNSKLIVESIEFGVAALVLALGLLTFCFGAASLYYRTKANSEAVASLDRRVIALANNDADDALGRGSRENGKIALRQAKIRFAYSSVSCVGAAVTFTAEAVTFAIALAASKGVAISSTIGKVFMAMNVVALIGINLIVISKVIKVLAKSMGKPSPGCTQKSRDGAVGIAVVELILTLVSAGVTCVTLLNVLGVINYGPVCAMVFVLAGLLTSLLAIVLDVVDIGMGQTGVLDSPEIGPEFQDKRCADVIRDNVDGGTGNVNLNEVTDAAVLANNMKVGTGQEHILQFVGPCTVYDD